jgi:hypothetical protein
MPSKFSWPFVLAFACIFWGIAILLNQHHLSVLVPVLGAYLLTFGVAVAAIDLFSSQRKR